MLQGMRKAGQSWVGRLLVSVLFGFLILSFAIWGIGDIFRGYGRNTVAQVGSAEITITQVRAAYQTELQRLQRQMRRPITPDQARAMGLEAQVLGRLVTEAVLDQEATRYKLGITDQWVARAIQDDATFKGPTGQFDKARFDDLLRSNGYTEQTFVAEQHASMVRRQIPEGLAGGLSVPEALKYAVFRYSAERRAADYFILPASAAGEIAAPDDAALQRFFDERKNSFRAPEYRKLVVLALTPDRIAKPDQVSDADARAHYDKVKASRFGTPERRAIQQIAFPDEASAKAASDRIKAGASFEDIAKERGIDLKDAELGKLSRADIIDDPVRDAAFALGVGAVSSPIMSGFGPVLLRVTSVEPEKVKPFEEVTGEVKADVARDRAKAKITDLHDRIDDQRASAKPLVEIGPTVDLSPITVEAIDRDGRDKAGNPVTGLPDKDNLVAAAFNSDIGADNEVLRTADGGYVWFEVTGIDPSRERTLAEVRPQVEALWRADETASRLAAKARELVGKINEGEAVAAAAGALPLQTATDLQRATARGDLSVPAVNQIFATNVGKAGSVAIGDGDRRVVFKVTEATLPPMGPTSIDARLDEQIGLGITDDLLTTYVRAEQNKLGITVNQQALRNAIGTSGEY